MRSTFARFLAFLTLHLVAAPLAGGGQVIEADTPRLLGPLDLFELEWARDPNVAPDGSHVAYVRSGFDRLTDRPRSDIWRVNVDGTEHRPVVAGASAPRFSPDGSRLAYLRATDTEGVEIFVRWLDSGETLQVTRLPERPTSMTWSPDSEWLAFTMAVPRNVEPLAKLPSPPEGAEWAPPPVVIEDFSYRSDGAGYLTPEDTQLFVVPSDGGSARSLTSGPFDVSGSIAWSSDGESIVFSSNRREDRDLEPSDSDLYRVPVGGGDLERLTDRYGPDEAPSINAEGRIVYFGYDDELLGYHQALPHLRDLDAGVRGSSKAHFEERDRSIESARWSADGQRILVTFTDHGVMKLAAIDPQSGSTQVLAEGLAGAGTGRPYTSGSFHEAGGVIVVTAGGIDRPADLASVGDDGALVPLTRLNEDLLAHRDLARLERIEARSSHDGRPLEGWALYPPGFDANAPHPLLLEIHGGPFLSYGPCFSFELQLMAAAGHVVLYGNPRGSTSYGAEFANLIHHNYPCEDGQDLEDLCDAVIARGGIDEERQYVTGGSGGGVLTAWLVGSTDRYRAAVSAKPVIHWTSFVLTADAYGFFTRWWFPSLPWEDPQHYWNRSPLSKVGNVTTPTMLLTGEEDYRTPISQSEEYYQALKLRGVDTALVRIPGASHGIASRPSRLIAKVLHILAWFERYDGPSATWWE